MNFLKLILKEISHSKINFTLSLLSATIAVASVAAAILFLRSHEINTREIIKQKEIETRKRVNQLKDDYRKITKRMGFNILILPKEQNLSDFYADDFASKYMPENYVDKLANSKIVTIRHLLPSLQQKLKWPEEKRTIILIGTRGEVPNAFKTPLKPLKQPVNPGEAVLGYELHNSLNISTGEYITLLGKKFRVNETYGERGNKDDITIWINLKDAQKLLRKENQINAILALECSCAWADLAKVREEIAAILPDTKVLESHSKALARAEARNRAAKEAVAALEQEKNHRKNILEEQKKLVFSFVPAVVFAASVWLALLSFTNARERRYEVGLFRALGFQSKNILILFLSKAALVGFIGALAGCVAGYFAACVFIENPGFLDLKIIIIICVFSIIFSKIAAFLPAIFAAGIDPAEILRED